MKKLYRSLLTIAISAPLLSGCDFFSQSDFPVETKKIETLSLRDYTKVVLQNQTYEYDGKVFVLYEDETEKEVTSYCTFGAVDTTTLGEKSFKVSYETTNKIYSKLGKVTVVDSIDLEGIEVSDYTEKVKMDETYTFDGKVTANYAGGLTKDVTSDAVINPLDTSSCGSKTLHISYTEGNITKTAEASIQVQPYFVEIVVSGYKSSYTLNEQLDDKAVVKAKYSDGTEKDVTSQATVDFSEVDTSKLGTYHLDVSYSEEGKTSERSLDILVVEKQPELQSIEARDYSLTVEKGSTYEFDGTVWATFDQGEPVNVTSDCSFSSISTSTTGAKTVTITYKDPNWDITKTCKITVTVVISVTGINADSSIKVGIGDSVKINASVTPTNATNKSLSYASQDESVATVDSNGNVTGVKKGGTSVIVSSVDKPSISKSVAVSVLDDPKVTSISASGYSTTVDKNGTYTFNGTVTASYSNGSSNVVTDNLSFSSISTSTGGNKTMTITYTDPVWGNSVSCQITITVISHVTGISVNSSFTVGLNGTTNLNASVLPTDATNKSLTYSSANTSIATVAANGEVTGKASGTTTITITSVDTPSVKRDVTVTVSDKDEWTILVYMSGSNLESDYASSNQGAATSDLKEIASVSGQPDDVNVVVQAGGSTKWSSTYSSVINKDKRNRFHLDGKTYVKDSQDSKVNMGLSSTLADFIVWGVTNYPANKIGLILWNHGGAMDGCCYDDQYSGGDPLTPTELNQGINSAKTQLGYSNSTIFEFIGYDCCLMQVQDIAGLNSKHAKYQVASQEAEWGDGWTYDEWVDDLFSKKTTPQILTAIVDSFKSATVSYYGSGSSNDQTLSYLNLSYWDAYETAFEAFASSLSSVVTSSTAWSTFSNVVNSSQKFGYYEEYNAYPYDVFDVKNVFSKMKASSSYKNNSTLMSKISDCETAYNNLVGYEWHGGGSSGATGLSLFCPVSGYNTKNDTYPTTATTLTNWRTLCIKYGTWYSY